MAAEGQQTDTQGQQTDTQGIQGEQTDIQGEQTDIQGEQTDIQGQQTDIQGEQTDTQGQQTDIQGEQTDTQREQTDTQREQTDTQREQTDTQGDSETQEPTRTGNKVPTICSTCVKKLNDCTLGTFSLTAIIIFGVITVCFGINTFVEGSTYILGALLCLIGGMLVAGACYLCCKPSYKYKTLPSTRPQNRMFMRGQAANPWNTSPSNEQSSPLVPESQPGSPQAVPVITPGQSGHTVLVRDPLRPGCLMLIPSGHDGSHSVPPGHDGSHSVPRDYIIPTAPPIASREDDLPPAYEDVVKNPPVYKDTYNPHL